MQEYTFVVKHKHGSLNKVADALSHRVAFINSLSFRLEGFNQLQMKYKHDIDFGKIYELCKRMGGGLFHLQGGFLMRDRTTDGSLEGYEDSVGKGIIFF